MSSSESENPTELHIFRSFVYPLANESSYARWNIRKHPRRRCGRLGLRKYLCSVVFVCLRVVVYSVLATVLAGDSTSHRLPAHKEHDRTASTSRWDSRDKRKGLLPTHVLACIAFYALGALRRCKGSDPHFGLNSKQSLGGPFIPSLVQTVTKCGLHAYGLDGDSNRRPMVLL